MSVLRTFAHLKNIFANFCFKELPHCWLLALIFPLDFQFRHFLAYASYFQEKPNTKAYLKDLAHFSDKTD